MTERKPFQFEGSTDDAAWSYIVGQLFHQRHRQLERVIAAVKAAPLPMPPDIMAALIQLGPNDIYKVLRAHPGFALWQKKRSYETSFEVFERSFHDLQTAIGQFEVACRDGLLFSESRDEEQQQHERAVQKELFAAATAAHSLVDHSRRLRKEADIAGFDERRKAAFGNDGLHETIIGLRNILHHFHVLKAGWEWTKTFGEGGGTAYSFNLDRDSLLDIARDRQQDLSRFDKIERFLSASPAKLEIRQLFEEYEGRASSFHTWLFEQLKADSLEALRDYEHCLKENRNFAKRSYWRAMLGSWLKSKEPPNPYDHLQYYLSAKQLREVYQLPLGSPEQVDKIIAFVDVDGACDEQLREQIYEFFRRGAEAKARGPAPPGERSAVDSLNAGKQG